MAKTLFLTENRSVDRAATIGQFASGRITLLFMGGAHDGEYFDLKKPELPKAKRIAKAFVKTGRVPKTF